MNTSPILEGTTWVWPDGTTLPLVSGGSDLDAVGVDPPATDPPAAAPPAGDPPPADAPAAGDPPPPADPAGDDARFADWPEEARAERQRLLDENIKYRQRWKPYEETFGALHEDDQGFMLGFVDAFRSGDKALLAEYAAPLRAYLDKMTPAQQAAAVEAIEQAAGVDDSFDPFDKAQLEDLVTAKARALLDERDATQAEARAQAEREAEVARIAGDIKATAKALAAEHGVEEWEDPTSGLYAALVSVARGIEGETTLEARMAKAAEKLTGELDRRGQALLKAKTAGAGQAPAPQGGDEPSGRTEPLTLDDAAESALRRLEAIERGPTGN